MTLAELHAWIDGLGVNARLKGEMKRLRPCDYTGVAGPLCDRVAAEAEAWLDR